MIALSAVQEKLNMVLKKHSKYEPWMNFIAVNEEGAIYSPLVTTPQKIRTKLKYSDWVNIYKEAITKVALELKLTFSFNIAPVPSKESNAVQTSQPIFKRFFTRISLRRLHLSSLSKGHKTHKMH